MVRVQGRELFVVYLLLQALPSLPYQVSKQMVPPILFAYRARLLEKQTMNEEPHIGQLIKEELARQGRSITWLAKQLGYSRQNAYKVFSRKWIYTDLLLKISDLLDYDFFKCFSEWRENRDKPEN